MGAVSLSKMNGAETGSRAYRFQCLMATMLSPQTKDKQTHAAFVNLVKLVSPNPLTASALAVKSIEEIQDACRPVAATSASSPTPTASLCTL